MKLLLILALAAPFSGQASQSPPTERTDGIQTACKGCGCRGGPGWRINRTGKCAGKANLTKECGNPPSPARCIKEN